MTTKPSQEPGDREGKQGRPTRALHINIDADLHERMGVYRATHGVTITAQVEEAIREHLRREGY